MRCSSLARSFPLRAFSSYIATHRAALVVYRESEKQSNKQKQKHTRTVVQYKCNIMQLGSSGRAPGTGHGEVASLGGKAATSRVACLLDLLSHMCWLKYTYPIDTKTNFSTNVQSYNILPLLLLLLPKIEKIFCNANGNSNKK